METELHEAGHGNEGTRCRVAHKVKLVAIESSRWDGYNM
jgi:hypothetical protein